MTKTDISEGFRVFAHPQRITNQPAKQLRNNNADDCHKEITVYTDGASINNRKEDARCGSEVWFGIDDQRNTAFSIPSANQSNQIGELTAVILVIQKILHFISVQFITDSKYVIDGLITNLQNWEDNGWIKTKNT